MEVTGYATLYKFFLAMGNLIIFCQSPMRFCRSCDGLPVSLHYTQRLPRLNPGIFRPRFETFTYVVRVVYDNICE